MSTCMILYTQYACCMFRQQLWPSSGWFITKNTLQKFFKQMYKVRYQVVKYMV